MATHPMDDAFAHNTWATLRVIDTCFTLSPEQLETSVPGTYGSILDTLRHLVAADSNYLFVCSGQTEDPPIEDEQTMDLGALRSAIERFGPKWAALLDRDPDPGMVLVRHRPDGSETTAPLSIRLAQAVHHGTDHRSQMCTALTNLRIEPPFIDVWAFGEVDGRVIDTPPTA
jgi:uncharacterized damage-inducible protein DinB